MQSFISDIYSFTKKKQKKKKNRKSKYKNKIHCKHFGFIKVNRIPAIHDVRPDTTHITLAL